MSQLNVSTVRNLAGTGTPDTQALGQGQTWQSFTIGTQRVAGTTYTNTTGRPIMLSISRSGAAGSILRIFVSGLEVAVHADGGGVATGVSLTVVVPTGATYSATVTGSSLSAWLELR